MKLQASKAFRNLVAAGCVSLLSATGIAHAADSSEPIVIPNPQLVKPGGDGVCDRRYV